jgi:putative chitinase
MNLLNLIDAQLLKIAAPETPAVDLAAWVQPIKAACERFEIDRVRRVAAFIAQMGHESGLKPRSENLNYSAGRMAEVWPARFSVTGKRGGAANRRARELAHNPEALANVVYGNRMGNGPPESGDGWRFRGTGPLQVTGRDNMTAFGKSMNMTPDQAVVYARTLEGGIMAAAWFWEENDINRLADTPGVEDESRRINGGTNGLADRRSRFDRVVAELLRRGA